MPRPRSNYDSDFRQSAVNLLLSSGRPLKRVAAELGVSSWGQFFLKWVLAQPAVTCVIPGTSRPAHMLDNLQAGMGPLPDEDQRRRMREYFLA